MKRTALNRSATHNEWFEELCALGAIGELSAAEFVELEQHRADCVTCRELYADFCRITSDDIGFAAIEKQVGAEAEDDITALNEETLLRQFLERARREQEARIKVSTPVVAESIKPSVSTGISRLWAWMHHRSWVYVAVGLVWRSSQLSGLTDSEMQNCPQSWHGSRIN